MPFISKTARKWLARIAIAVFIGAYVLNQSEDVHFSVISGLRAVGTELFSETSGPSNLSIEKNIYVLQTDYDEVINKGKTELVQAAGWTFIDYPNLGGGPFADFVGRSGDHKIRVIRGDRTLPEPIRERVPKSERHKWVVVTDEVTHAGFKSWLSGLWKRIKGP